MEEFEKIFNKFHNRLKLEGLLKALLIGAAIGFSISMIVALILFIVSYNAIWIAVISLIFVTIISTIILYFVKFKPNRKDVARRVDMEGLKERMITMEELSGSDSYMAKIQREDTIKQVEKVKDTKLKFNFSKKLISITSVVCIIGVMVITLTGFSLGGFLPSFDKMTNIQILEDFNIRYLEGEGGIILGDLNQTIKEGEDGSEVCAIAKAGYMFSIWSDGVKSPNRTDSKVKESLNVVAIFMPIAEEQDSGFIDDPNAPKPDFEMGDMQGEMPEGVMGGAGKYEEYNQVIDGETYYRDVLKQYYDKAQEILNSGGVVPEYMRIIIEEYYEVIK